MNLNDLLKPKTGLIPGELETTILEKDSPIAKKYLYHVTFTKNVPNIKKKGLIQFQPSNWIKGPGGDRYNNDIAGIFAFDHPEDALNWAGKMEWEFRDTDKDMSIVRIDMEDFWEDDPAEDPFVSNKGKAKYSPRDIKADKIIDVLDMSGIKRPGDLGISRDEWLADVSKKLEEMFGGGGIPDYTTMPAYGLKRASKGKHKFFVPKGEKLPAGVGAIKEADEDEDKDPVGKSYANQPIVYVDMDGVLVDFFGEWANMHGVENWRDIAPLLKKQGKTINDALDAIRAKKDFWINLKPETGAKTLLATIKKYAGEYTILSSPLSNDPNSIPQKRAWVKNNLSAFPPKEVIIHKRKQDYATQADGTPNILIDDFSEQVKPWKAAGGIAFKHSNRQVTKTTDALKQHFETAVTEAYKTRIKIGDVLHRADHAINAAKQLNAKVVRTASGYYKVAPLDDPRPAVTVNTDYYDQQQKLNKEIRQLRQQTGKIEDKFNSERRKIFDKLDSLFPNSKHGDEKSSRWLRDALDKLDKKYFGTPEFLQLTAEIRAKEQELKQLVDSNKRSVPLEGLTEATQKYYHGSYDKLDVGTVLTPGGDDYESSWGGTNFYGPLEKFRPPEKLAHKEGVFMVGNDDDVDVAGGATDYVYAVEPVGEVQKHDLNWGSEISMLIDDGYTLNDPEVKEAAENYWNGVPHHNEQVWEYLAPRAKIVSVLDEAWKVKVPKKSKRKMSKQDTDWSMLRTALESDLFEAGTGDCFEIANRAMIHMTEEQETYGMKCVHAYVYGQGELKGRRFPHAWNEQGDIVLDNSNGNNIVMRKEQYYALGGVVQESGAYVTYDKDDCLIKMLKYSHYGPWDLNDSLDENIPDEAKEIGKEKSRIPRNLLNTIKDELDLEAQVESAWERFKSDVA